MCGGLQSFGAGGYAATALANVLPVEMDDFERQRPGEPVRADVHLSGQPKLRPTAIGQRHFVMRLGSAAENASLWDQLRPLEAANQFRGLSPRANVLAESENGKPLLVAQNFGNGRVMAFAGWSTWRWWLDGFQEAHQRFWRQVVLWLARKDELNEGTVDLRLEGRRFQPGGRVDFTVRALSATGEPLPGASYDVQAILPRRHPPGDSHDRWSKPNAGIFLRDTTARRLCSGSDCDHIQR